MAVFTGLPATRVSYQTVEYHRFGISRKELERDNQYIRATGWDDQARILSPGVDALAFRRALNALTFPGASDSDRTEAIELLKTEAGNFLTAIRPTDGELLQVDLVTNAAELWAFPFEACFVAHPEWVATADQGVVLTRRIRGDFSPSIPPWPAVPRILFAHAPVAGDLSQALIDRHLAALVDALEPWASGKSVPETGLLRVCEVRSADDLARQRDAFSPAQVHILAHGARTLGDPLLPEAAVWGLRLGDERTRGTPPDEVAEALRPKDGVPLVVTLAACDAANQQNSLFAPISVVQSLHRSGIPVVIGSQLPLTQEGSVALTATFYHWLLQGQDVRAALHAARVALKAEDLAGFDWLSLVGYVRLPPEGYATHLRRVGLAMRLQLLRAASAEAALLIEQRAHPAKFARVQSRLGECLDWLRAWRTHFDNKNDLIEENRGLEASALKRQAELLFWRGSSSDPPDQADLLASRERLTLALEAYRAAFDDEPRSHWLGIQQLALEIALKGRATRPEDWLLVSRMAELDRDRPASEGATNYWSCGTLGELQLLAAADRPEAIETAAEAFVLLVSRARQAGHEPAIASTYQQIERYVKWWTNENGFFPDRRDLRTEAQRLLHILK